jgi:hypothetical protein
VKTDFLGPRTGHLERFHLDLRDEPTDRPSARFSQFERLVDREINNLPITKPAREHSLKYAEMALPVRRRSSSAAHFWHTAMV